MNVLEILEHILKRSDLVNLPAEVIVLKPSEGKWTQAKEVQKTNVSIKFSDNTFSLLVKEKEFRVVMSYCDISGIRFVFIDDPNKQIIFDVELPPPF
jgi:hypothetical protein